jgi:thiol-disulfide isomerase/thioredoxin
MEDPMNRPLLAALLTAPLVLAGCGSSHDTAAPAAAVAPAGVNAAAGSPATPVGMQDDGMHDGMTVPAAAPAAAAAHMAAMPGMHDDGMGDGMQVADAKAATTPATLNFTAKTVTGAAFSGSSLAGHGAVLWFWAPGCADCVKLAPAVLAAEQANPGVTFIGVAGLADAGAMKKAAASMHIDGFTQLADLRGVLWRKFGVTSQPAFAFIDKNGKLSVHKGSMSSADLAKHTAAVAG